MKATILALAGAIAVSAAGASLAQPAPAPGDPARQAHAWRRPDPAQMAEKHAERLRAVLQLRPDQEPALRALIDASRPDPARMERRRQERGEARNLTTPQRLERAQARMAERQAAFSKRAEAIRRFYAQLSPTQQRAFDALHEGRGGMAGRKHGRGFGHGGGPDLG